MCDPFLQACLRFRELEREISRKRDKFIEEDWGGEELNELVFNQCLPWYLAHCLICVCSVQKICYKSQPVIQK